RSGMAQPDPRYAGVQRTRDVGIEPVADHHGLVQGNAQPPGALTVDLGIGLRFAEVPRGYQGVDQPEDPRLFKGIGQLGITRSDRVRDDAEAVTRLECRQHLEDIRNRGHRHLPQMLARLLHQERVTRVEKDAGEWPAYQAGAVA